MSGAAALQPEGPAGGSWLSLRRRVGEEASHRELQLFWSSFPRGRRGSLEVKGLGGWVGGGRALREADKEA